MMHLAELDDEHNEFANDHETLGDGSILFTCSDYFLWLMLDAWPQGGAPDPPRGESP